jgi:hypothetical protein
VGIEGDGKGVGLTSKVVGCHSKQGMAVLMDAREA